MLHVFTFSSSYMLFSYHEASHVISAYCEEFLAAYDARSTVKCFFLYFYPRSKSFVEILTGTGFNSISRN